MSLKYSILNVSYQQAQQQSQSDDKFRKTIKRYSDYTKNNKFSQPTNQPHFHFEHNSNKKLSLYQQYKNRQMLRKIKKIDERTHQDSLIKGKLKEKEKLKFKQIPNISITDSFVFQTVHSQLKPQTPSSRRKMTVPLMSSQPNCYRQIEGQQSSRGMGIIGVQSSFLDKYKLKTPGHKYSSSFNDEEKDNRIKRMQFLCSMKRNRSLEPKTVRGLEFKRNFSSKKQNCLSVQRDDDRVLCRPWSPSGEDQFQKI